MSKKKSETPVPLNYATPTGPKPVRREWIVLASLSIAPFALAPFVLLANPEDDYRLFSILGGILAGFGVVLAWRHARSGQFQTWAVVLAVIYSGLLFSMLMRLFAG